MYLAQMNFFLMMMFFSVESCLQNELNMLLKILNKIILGNHGQHRTIVVPCKQLQQIQFLVFASLACVLSKQTQIKNKSFFTFRALGSFRKSQSQQKVCFWLVLEKNICTAQFLGYQELHPWSTWKANICIFLYTSVRKCLFLVPSKLLSGGGGEGADSSGRSLFGTRKIFKNFSF